MNCIFLLLLLGCCGGWGNGCAGNTGCGNGCRRNDGCERDNRRDDCGCMETGRGNRTERTDSCRDGMERDRRGRDGGDCCRKPEPCGCEQERPCQEPAPCGCAREERECEGTSSAIIPPPWQDYPKFPRRDNGECCES